jgi:hypothetical protein
MIGGGIAQAVYHKYFDKKITNDSDLNVDLQAAFEEGEKKIA